MNFLKHWRRDFMYETGISFRKVFSQNGEQYKQDITFLLDSLPIFINLFTHLFCKAKFEKSYQQFWRALVTKFGQPVYLLQKNQ